VSYSFLIKIISSFSLVQFIFVCVTSIGVKSKYGSCSGNCTGLIKVNNKLYIYILYIQKEGSVCWYDGLSCKLNSLLLSKVQFLFFLNFVYFKELKYADWCNSNIIDSWSVYIGATPLSALNNFIFYRAFIAQW
jgi:hypothetical protein